MGSEERRPYRVILGTMTFGGQTSPEDAARMVGMFLDAGHSWIDTAYIYQNGRTEEILGSILGGGLREKVFLATKVHPGPIGEHPRVGLGPAEVRRQVEASLARLRTDYVDLLYLHQPDNDTPLAETLAACNELVREGKVRELGLSNYAAWQVAEAVLTCKHEALSEPVIYQGMYNALTRDVERELIPACRRFGQVFVAYNPLAGGLLTGKYESFAAEPRSGRFADAFPWYRARFWKESYFRAVDEVRPVAQRLGISLTEAALRWLLHHSAADGVILGASRVEQLDANLAACRAGPLPEELRQALDRAWEIARPDCPRYFRD